VNNATTVVQHRWHARVLTKSERSSDVRNVLLPKNYRHFYATNTWKKNPFIIFRCNSAANYENDSSAHANEHRLISCYDATSRLGQLFRLESTAPPASES
jgi:hypothetical protein